MWNLGARPNIEQQSSGAEDCAPQQRGARGTKGYRVPVHNFICAPERQEKLVLAGQQVSEYFYQHEILAAPCGQDLRPDGLL